MFSLSDSELNVILNLAAPLDPAMRDPFLRAVAIELARHPADAIGPGLLQRLGRDLQRRFLKDGPLAVGGAGVGKYGRPDTLWVAKAKTVG